jgi:dTDP-4-amino-4,6-dideoxygalactose transaminase
MGRERYYYDHVGYTSRLAEIQAAVLRTKLTRLAAWNARRKEIAAVYLEQMKAEGVRLPAVAMGNEPTWHQFTVLAERRDALQAHLKDQGVASMIYYPVPLHFHEPYAHLGFGKGDLPITERVCETCLSLPVHQHMEEGQALHVAASVNAFASKAVRV